MSKSRYYRLLGLSPGANQNEIRKQYRKLAMKYHPDRNPNPNAEQMFIKLTEAYEILMDKRPVQAEKKTHKSKEKSTEERVKEARKRYAEQAVRQKRENERYFKYLTKGPKWRVIKWSARIGIVLSLLLVSDLFLPTHFEEQKVTHFKPNVGYGPNGHRINLIKTESEQYFWFGLLNYSLYNGSRSFYLESSWFFHNPIKAYSKNKISKENFNLHFTVYHSWPLLLIFFLIPSYTMRYKRMSVGFTMLYHLSYYASTMAIVIFLLTGNRWAHLITLGFL